MKIGLDEVKGAAPTTKDLATDEFRLSLAKDGRRFLVAMEEIASVVGPDFFASAGRLLGELLDVRYVFVSECLDSNSKVSKTLAFWNGDGLAESVEFCAEGGPCERVLAGEVVHYKEKVLDSFPDNASLHSLAPESYFGTPMVNSSGRVIGHIAAMDVRPFDPTPEDLVILKILAARSGAELERRLIEEDRTSDLVRANESLRGEIASRRRAEDSMRRSEEQLRLVTDAVPVCIAYADSDQRYQFNNKTYEDWFGLKREEIKGRLLKDVLGDATYEAIREHVETALSGRSVSYETSLSIAGRERYVSSYYVPHVGPDGEVKGYFAVVADATERKRAEEVQRKLEEKIRHGQKLESLGVMAGGIAHDFNNLLMGVLGNADLALMDLPPESPAGDRLKQISLVAQRAAELTGQMLAYSGKGRLEVQRLDLSNLVREMAHLLEVSISKKARLKLDLAEGLPAVEGDAGQIRQVVMNLILNASEAIGDQDGTVRLSTGLTESCQAGVSQSYLDEAKLQGDCVYLEVADTGCGMDEETKAKIFDPFFTTKFTGRGLGLAAVLGIVRGHKGALRVESRPRRGSTFCVLFPASERPASVSEGTPDSEQSWQGSGLILVVDDEEIVRAVVKRILEKAGFTVLTAEDGREGLRTFREHADEITAVVADLTMPHLGGQAVLQEIRRIRPDAKAILSSGYSEHELEDRFAGGEPVGFVQKPYSPGKLVESIRQLLEGDAA